LSDLEVGSIWNGYQTGLGTSRLSPDFLSSVSVPYLYSITAWRLYFVIARVRKVYGITYSI
ncbi:MAG: hypothetical protein QW456_12035, partial [Ignisphaera sp.]